MTEDLKLFDSLLISGYKQAIKSDDVPGNVDPIYDHGAGD